MDELIYNNNLEALKEKYIDIYDWLVESTEEPTENVIIDKSANGEYIVAIRHNSRIWYLNSKYNDEEYADNCMKQYDKFSYQEIFLFFGMANFSFISKMSEKIYDTNVIIAYEPDKSIFKEAIKYIDITRIINNNNIAIVVGGVNEKFFQQCIEIYVNYSKMNFCKVYPLPNYTKIYGKKYEEFKKRIVAAFESTILFRNTAIIHADQMGENVLYNYRDIVNQYSINQIKEHFEKVENIEDIPLIIVSAGPSLDKNIEDIKLANGNVFILAVDTALRPLLRHGIKPDLVITVDRKKDAMLFAHTDFENLPLMVCVTANRKIWSMHKGKRFYFADSDNYPSVMYKKFKNEELYATQSGGSVANNAFSAAIVMGFKKIIMIGQDLSYPNNVIHANDSYGVGADENINNKGLYYVEDIYGGKVLTEANMDCYRKWFEQQIVLHPELEVIDATEGGAKINGTKIMTLSEAIDEYCHVGVDFTKIIDEIPQMFDENEKEEFNKEIDSIPDKLETFRKRIEKGKRDYDRMDMLNRRNKVNTKEFRTLVEKVGKLSEDIQSDPAMGLASIYNQLDEYEVLGNVFDNKESVSEDVSDVVKSGIKMLDSYIKAIDKLEGEIQRTSVVEAEEINKEIDEFIEGINALKNASVEEADTSKINEKLKDFYRLFTNVMSDIDLYESNINLDLSVEKDKLYNILYNVEKMDEYKNYEKIMDLDIDEISIIKEKFLRKEDENV